MPPEHDRAAPVHPLDDVLPGEARVLEAAHESLARRRRGLRGAWPFLGPAFVASVAYVDPGNFATNMAAGAEFGYLLLWVILTANLMGMVIQSMSAKLGIATGMNLPEVCRERFPRTASFLLWIQAELIAMAKREPGRLTYASSGIAAGPHLASALLARQAGIEVVHVPYRGSAAAMADVLAGQVSFNFSTIPQASPLVQMALIDFVVETQDRGAADVLRQLSGDARSDQTVRTRAAWGLEHLGVKS